MNEKFFSLPEEKQQAIINAGYRVFSQNTYKKSPVSEIAAEAGISKSLLFHYFRNKKELYLFLWEKCAQVTIEYMKEYGCYDKKDLFDMMYSGMQVKIKIRLDLRMMYREMYLASEGYVWEMVSSGKIDADKMEKDFTEIIEFWKSIFLRKGQTPQGSAKGE